MIHATFAVVIIRRMTIAQSVISLLAIDMGNEWEIALSAENVRIKQIRNFRPLNKSAGGSTAPVSRGFEK